MHPIGYHWALGVALGLLGSLLSVLSKICMRKSDLIDARNGPGTAASAYHMTIGILLMLANPPLTVASFAFAPQTVVAGALAELIAAGPQLVSCLSASLVLLLLLDVCVAVTAATDSMFYTVLASSLLGDRRGRQCTRAHWGAPGV